MLKKLFLKIHPDLFGDRPAERATNEASFAKLQQFLDDYTPRAQHIQTQPVNPRSVDLTFFVKQHAAPKSLRIDVALHTPYRAPSVSPDVAHLRRTMKTLFVKAELGNVVLLFLLFFFFG